MQQKSLQKLEYQKIIDQLAAFCHFAVSREQAEALLPVDNSYEASQLLLETDEARELLRLQPLFSLGGLWDVRDILHRGEIGGIFTPEDLLAVASLCRAARTTKSFFSELKGSFPILQGLAKALVILKTVETVVDKAIDSDLSLKDGASERLQGIRHKKRMKSEQIRSRLDSMIKNPNTAKFLQDPIVTIREGRFVVPVKQEYRGQVAGVTHDMSSSGATVFIEPLAVMELNNDLSVLKAEEEDEIAAILRALTMVVVGFQNEIQADLTLLAKMDFILAKGQLSHEYDGVSPKVNEHGRVRLVKARHPLIAAASVVPIDLEIGQGTTALIITGPNTGGKTVTLKTIGLLTCMGLSGLHIPADPGSEIFCCHAVLADIGDEQSIEQNLSTFSSHMRNIVEILGRADQHSLLLFDELGAGTDPTEGAALAMSILGYAQQRGAKIVATTHYSELKAFAYNTPGFLNASMEFDLATLSPTYHLMMGMPGKSNAFEISRRLGLPEQIIADAAGSLSSEDIAVTSMLANLEDMRRELTLQQQQMEQLAAEISQREQAFAEKERKLEASEAEIIRKAHRSAERILDETLAKTKALYEEQQRKMAEQKEAQKAWQQSQQKLKSWRQQLEEAVPEPVYAGQAPKKVILGETVFLPKLNQYGTVATLPSANGELMIQVGVLKLSAQLSEIRLADEKKLERKPQRRGKGGSSGDLSYRKAALVTSTLDLHGLDTMEALPLLDKYIDDAFIAGLREVQINHGRGTGALRKFVHQYLHGHRLVKSYRDGTYHEGGIGVTIVVLDL